MTGAEWPPARRVDAWARWLEDATRRDHLPRRGAAGVREDTPRLVQAAAAVSGGDRWATRGAELGIAHAVGAAEAETLRAALTRIALCAARGGPVERLEPRPATVGTPGGATGRSEARAAHRTRQDAQR